MSSEQAARTEIFQFLDPHHIIEILDFELSITKDSTKKVELTKLKKDALFKTFLFEEQSKFLSENKSLFKDNESECIENKKQQIKKVEEETKNTISGFLNLMENFRKNNNFDISFSIHKKIVEFILTFRLMKPH